MMIKNRMGKPFPYIEVSGDYSTVGAAIGRVMGHVIRQKVDHRRKNIPNYQKLLAASRIFRTHTEQTFPHLIEEARAIANASNVPFEEFFLLTNREARLVVGSDHCTIAVSKGDDGTTVIGHNEDEYPEDYPSLYILKATIGDTTFMGLHYATGVPGSSASINSHGLVQCINYVSYRPETGVPKDYVARAILEAKTLDEAEDIICGTKRASGYNHVLVQSGEIRNIEVSAMSYVSQHPTETFVHTNHFLSEAMKQYETEVSQSSLARYARANTLIKPAMSTSDMKALLSDKANGEFPICRHSGENQTLASVIFDPNARAMLVCSGHPCADVFRRYTIQPS